MDDVFLRFDVSLGRYKMFGGRLKSKSKKRRSGSTDRRVVMFCEDIPSERSSSDSGWGSQSSGVPPIIHRKEGQRSSQPAKTFSSQKIHHMSSTFSGHNVGPSTLCIRD